MAIRDKRPRFYASTGPGSVPGAILAALAAIVVIGCFQRVLEIGPSAGFFAATDVGLYVTLIGALLSLVGALRRIPVRRER